MSKEISKSPEMLLKEARITELTKLIKKKRSTLKSLKTRLANTKQNITDIQRTMSSAYMRMMDKVTAIKDEISASLKQLRKLKGLSKEEKEQLDLFSSEIDEVGQDENAADYEEFKRKMEEGDFDFDEHQRAKMHDIFEEFQVKPDEKEQRNIRKVFIKLSVQFHPDKARNPKQAEEYHSLMQAINEAYQANDIDKLLELEQLYLGVEDLNYTSKAITVDVLQQHIERLERDLDFITNQVERTSAEIKQLRASDLGKMHTEMTRAEKQGMGIDTMTAEMDEQVTSLEELRDVLKECEKQKSIQPFYDMTMNQPFGGMGNPFLDFDEDDFGEDNIEDFMDFVGKIFEEKPVKNPKFKVGTSVRIKRAVKHEGLPEVNFKNWEGRVERVYREIGEIKYEIHFDSIAMNAKRKEIELLVDEGEDFGGYVFLANQLEKSKARDTEAERQIAYRTHFHQLNWEMYGEKEDQLMQTIMLQFPAKTDEENWEYWFKENLKFPFSANIRGYFPSTRGKGKIIGLYGWNERAGQLVLLDKGKGLVQDHPLFDLDATGKYALALEMYHEWLDTDELFGY